MHCPVRLGRSRLTTACVVILELGDSRPPFLRIAGQDVHHPGHPCTRTRLIQATAPNRGSRPRWQFHPLARVHLAIYSFDPVGRCAQQEQQGARVQGNNLPVSLALNEGEPITPYTSAQYTCLGLARTWHCSLRVQSALQPVVRGKAVRPCHALDQSRRTEPNREPS